MISQSAYDEQKNKHDLALETLKEAKQNLEYTTLKAPFDGIVSVRLVDNFTTVSVGTPQINIGGDIVDKPEAGTGRAAEQAATH